MCRDQNLISETDGRTDGRTYGRTDVRAKIEKRGVGRPLLGPAMTTTKRKQKWLVLVLITAYFERLMVLLYAIFFSSVPSSPSSPSLLADLPLEAGLAMESEQQQFVFTKENFNNPKLSSGLKIMQVRYVKWCKSRTLCNRNYIK